MRRGMQGHVALPRGRAHLPTWRGCDTWTRIYIYYIYYFIKYIGLPIIERQFTNRIITAYLIYPIDSLYFFLVGLFHLVYFDFRATWQHSARWIKTAINGLRRCGGHEVHPIKKDAHASNNS